MELEGSSRHFKEVAIEAATTAGRLLRQGFGKVHEVNLKSSWIDLVTEFDRRSEKEIIRLIRSKYPEHSILSEEQPEGKEAQPPREGDSGYRWIVDPLDGTTNYAHGYLVFSVSIALEKQGKLLIGVVYSPILEELFTAEAGRGAYLNGSRIKVSDTANLSESLLATGFPYAPTRIGLNLEHFTNFIYNAQGVRRDGSAALDLCYVACGRFDGIWELDLLPWDLAAGSLMVREAGGRVTDFRGGDFSIYGNELLASNGKIHQAMIEVLGS